jgi:hypothetical protein
LAVRVLVGRAARIARVVAPELALAQAAVPGLVHVPVAVVLELDPVVVELELVPAVARLAVVPAVARLALGPAVAVQEPVPAAVLPELDPLRAQVAEALRTK